MKKDYLKPDAEYLVFYTQESITIDGDIEGPGVDIGEGENSQGWE